MTEAAPHPGSDEAIKAGCICPVIDNGHGKGMFGNGERFGWIMVVGCPVHKPVIPLPERSEPS